ncbi:MAG: 5-(carboxyamino)imidazole ribonucleotide mutase [Nitrospiraceae bacterium]|nr:5-(carboxyamino)imidazole ribonucleotide mutase [Nitrospiraceae bacterium]
MKHKVLIIMGSDSDLPLMEEAGKMLDSFAIPYEMRIASAHRSPELVDEIVSRAEKEGVAAIIAGAGAAAHLAGVIASKTTLPVIGVPIDSSPLKGVDALYATVQMPPGVPVATMAVGKAGAKNAGIFAAQIVASSDRKVERLLKDFKRSMAAEVKRKSRVKI